MLNRYLLPSVFVALPVIVQAQATFTNTSTLLNTPTHTGGSTGVADFNGDGLDDILILDESKNVVIEFQRADGSFDRVEYGAVSAESQWGWALGDTDNDGILDVFCGGSYDGVHHMKINGVTGTVSDLNNGSIFMQCANMADMNNDGWLDAFACHDDGAPRQWYNDGNGTLDNYTGIDFTTNPVSDMSGNYGNTFTDFDNDGDIDFYITKCRQFISDPTDPRRWNRLFVNDGNGNYTDQATAYGLFNNGQNWASDFGDIDNDGDFDVVTVDYSDQMYLYENDGTGHYTEITAGSGLEVPSNFFQVTMRDFDNDGFLDIMMSGWDNAYFKGNGDGTFTEETNKFPASKTMHTHAVGDLNNDGFVDVFAGYGDGYVDPDMNFADRIWMNDGNANHWFGVRLRGTVSNRSAVGARTWLYGPWGVQTREVRAGESYGIVNSFAANFGLGNSTQIDSLVVTWPAGGRQVFTGLSADQYVSVVEGECMAPFASITGPTVVCPGQSIDLTVSSGNGYTWSTGSTAQTITVNAAGIYSVTVDNGNGCTSWTSYVVLENPDETPEVSLSGTAEFCDGESVTLTSSNASGYTWSNGEFTQSIVVTSTGNYSVTVPSSCGTSTSSVVAVNVLSIPVAPTANDVFLPAPGTANLNATGANVSWYDAAVGGNTVGSGNSWTTPFLNSSTTYWCSDMNGSGDPAAFGGETDRDGTNGQYLNNNNNYLLFDATQDFILVSVKVYAQGAANRVIEALDENGNILAQGTFAVPDGESRVELNFAIPAGTNHSLRCGTGNPQLWRDGLNSNPTYPYQLGTFGTITTSSASGGNALEYYYYFYDWEVADNAASCESPRTEVLVDVASSIAEVGNTTGITAWPNPANDQLNVSFPAGAGEVRITLADLSGRVVLGTQLDARALAAGVATIDLNGLAAGTYNLALAGGVNAVQRIVVR